MLLKEGKRKSVPSSPSVPFDDAEPNRGQSNRGDGPKNSEDTPKPNDKIDDDSSGSSTEEGGDGTDNAPAFRMPLGETVDIAAMLEEIKDKVVS